MKPSVLNANALSNTRAGRPSTPSPVPATACDGDERIEDTDLSRRKQREST
jgi:hypothetical protein